MRAKSVDEQAGRIELVLEDSVRIRGGAQAAFGGVFTAIGAGMLRLPMPLPFKLIPLAFVGIGAGISASGAMAALSDYSIVVERGRGLVLRWKWGLFEPKEIEIKTGDIESFEIVKVKEPADGADLVTFRLVVLKKTGDAHPLEEFMTETQAKLRKKMIKRALRGED